MELKENFCPVCSRQTLDYIISMVENNKEHIAMSFTLSWEMSGF